MDSVRRLFRVGACFVLGVAWLNIASPSEAQARVSCTVLQQLSCICSATSSCVGQFGDPGPDACWSGEMTSCEPPNGCQVQCWLIPKADTNPGVCEIIAQPGEEC